MEVDPLENDLDEWMNNQESQDGGNDIEVIEYSWMGMVLVGVDGDKGKVTRGWRTWSKMEKDALIHYLTEIINDGWKADNGFKVGFQHELNNGMRKLIPSTDIVANPHINSKIHVWKKEYGTLSDLLSKSGIGWDSSTHTLDIIDESVWDAQKWLEIFGNDRATGEHTLDPMDFVNELLKNVHEDQGETGGKGNIVTGEPGGKENIVTGGVGGIENNVAGEDENIPENTYVCRPSPESGVVTSKGKKRKGTMDEMIALVDTLGDFMKSTDESFNTIVKRMDPEHDAKQSRTNLNDIMKQILGLSVYAKLKVSDELVQNTARMDFFLSLPQDEQVEYVHMLLDGKLSSMP
ncbi:hypothetical protein ACS0TY_004244 [Phlomoides rotata]